MQTHPATMKGEARAILRLAGPLIANNLALAGMNLTDTVMAGRISAMDLAAVAVGSSVWMLVFLFGLGVLMAMSPMAAHSYGAGLNREVGGYARQSLWISQILAWTLLAALQLGAAPLLRAVGIDAAIVGLTAGYVGAIACGLPAMFAFLVLRFTSEGVGWTRPIMYMSITGFIVNVPANYVLMFGKLGFPALGAVGCGIASALVMWVMFLSMLAYVRRRERYAPFELFVRFEWPHWPRMRELLGLGFSIALTVIAEAGLFSTAGILMGTLGANVVAAHQIAINYAATMFMVPLALHSATTVHVGHALGRREHSRARTAGYTGIALCAGFMALSAVVMLLGADAIVSFYTRDPAVAEIASGLLLIAAVFQVSDGLQVGANGALRGFKDTRVPMFYSIFAYWCVGFPIAFYFGIVRQWGPRWVWIGLVAGLTAGAIVLTARYASISGRAPLPVRAAAD